MNTLLVPLVTGAEVTFWVVAPITILGALGLVLSRRAVYAALSVAVTMMGLAALYASLDAPFLAMVQIIVYTGAVLMMFLFVLMMVGITTPDSTVETLKGQRPLAILLTAHEAFRHVHGDAAHGILAEMLRHFEHEAVAAIGGFERVENLGQMTVELDVDDGADDLRHAAFCLGGGISHGCVLYFTVRALRRPR